MKRAAKLLQTDKRYFARKGCVLDDIVFETGRNNNALCRRHSGAFGHLRQDTLGVVVGLALLPVSVAHASIHIGRREDVGLVQQRNDAQENGPAVRNSFENTDTDIENNANLIRCVGFQRSAGLSPLMRSSPGGCRMEMHKLPSLTQQKKTPQKRLGF